MVNTYRVLLIEDDKSFAGALTQALNKQQLYAKPIEFRSFSYQEFELQFTEKRNSTREIIILGGRHSLNQEPDDALLQSILAHQERTHVFVMVTSLEAKNTLQYWHPGVSGIIERNTTASAWLVKALQKIQRRQVSTSTPPKTERSAALRKKGLFSQIRMSVFSFFV